MTTGSPALQWTSSSRRPATSPARGPSRTSSVKIAKSRRPVLLERSRESTSSSTCSGSSARGSPDSRYDVADGTAPTNERPIKPSPCKNPSSERSAVTVSLAAPLARAASGHERRDLRRAQLPQIQLTVAASRGQERLTAST
jgi:hypothetical protein